MTLELLNASIQAVLVSGSFEEAARIIFNQCKELTGARSGYVALLSEDGRENDVLFLDSGGQPCSVSPNLPMPVRGLRAETYRTGKPVFHNDFMNSEWISLMPEGHAVLDNVMFAPLCFDGKTQGIIGLANKPGGFTDEDAATTATLGELAAISLRNCRNAEVLRNSEERYKMMFENSSNCIAVYRADEAGNDFMITGFNKAAEEADQIGRKKIIGKSVLEVFPGIREFGLLDVFKRVWRTGQAEHYDAGIYSDSRITGWRKNYVFKLPSGEIAAVYEDITREKQYEQDIRESEERFRAVSDCFPSALYLKDAGGKYIFINRQAELLFEQKAGEVKGDKSAGIFTKEKAEEYSAQDKMVLESMSAMTFSDTITINGVKHFFDTIKFPLINAEGAPYAVACISTDITDRRHADDALNAALAELMVVHENAPVAMIIVDHDRRVRKINGAAASFARRPAGEMMGLRCGDALNCLHHLDSPEGCGFGPACETCAVRRAVIGTFETGEPRRDVEAWLPFPGGDCGVELKCLLVSTALLRLDDGERALICVLDITERKRSEEALRDSEERFRHLFESASDGVVYFDRKGILRDINPSALRIFGHERDALIDRDFFEAAPILGLTPEMMAESLRSILGGDTEKSEVWEITSQAGEKRFVNINPFLIRKDGVEAAFAMFISDITNQVKEERKREVNALILREIASSEDENTLIRNVVSRLREKLGFEAVGLRLRRGDDFPYYYTSGFPEEFVEAERFLCARDAGNRIIRDSNGNPYLECMCGNIISGRTDPEMPFFTQGGSFWSNCTTELLASTSDEDRQARTRNRCNGEGYESVALIPLKSGDKIVGLIQLNDSRKNMFTPDLIEWMEGLADSIGIGLNKIWSESKYRGLFSTIPDAIHIYDSNSLQIVDVNPAAEKLYGYPYEDFLKHGYETFSAEPPASMEALSLLKEKGAIEVPLRHHRKMDGSVFPVEISGRTFVAGDRKLLSLVIRDITERTRAEEERRNLQAQLFQSQKMEAIGQMAGGMAHDFNNMLGIIMGFSSLLLMDIKEDDIGFEEVTAILDAAKRAKDLSMKLLTLSRRDKLNVLPVYAGAIVNDLIQILGRTISRKIAINNIVNDAPVISCDKNQIHQAILNICLNARDAMPDGGTLSIEVSMREIESSLVLPPGKYCEIKVSDTGAGMPPEIVERVFEPFFTTKGLGKGTGLGLTTSHGIIRNHGGDILVSSEPGTGTAFRVLLPLATHSGILNKPASGIMEKPGTETILVVDDEPHLLFLSKKGLERLGYNVIAEDSGKNAVELYKERKAEIDVVILDMMMPGMDGRDVFLKIREENPSATVIISSGFSEDGKAEEMMSLGACGFIQKPFQMRELSEAIRNILDSRESEHIAVS